MDGAPAANAHGPPNLNREGSVASGRFSAAAAGAPEG